MSNCDCGKLHEECGVFAISNGGNEEIDVISETYYALYALQHRGQESCGISVNDSGVIHTWKDVGLVPEVFTAERLAKLPHGKSAIGHVRYAPNSQISAINAQPLVVKHAKGTLALAHNGNLVNATELRLEMQQKGTFFQTSNDTEVIAYLIASQRLTTPSIEAAVESAMEKMEGSYSFVVMSPQKIIAARDPHGFRPLCIGKLKDGGYIFSSETCALDAVGAEYIRDVKAGEIVMIYNNELITYKEGSDVSNGLCVFEFIYFARPDSVIEGASVHMARKRAGAFLAKSHPIEADVVIGVPDSGLDAAQGYALESGIPYGVGLLKNRYIGRTFIQPLQSQRENSVRIKLNAIAETVRGKRVIMVDDSIVRGTTSARIVRLLREAGATEVHMRVSSPPFINSCYFGTDIGNIKDLIACRMPIEDIADEIGVDSLGFLSLEDTEKIAFGEKRSFCTGCFSGKYPICIDKVHSVDKFEQKIK
ncbi:MAG: amidophosphoribosyltransferase [Oscillospiraceae bacterium]